MTYSSWEITYSKIIKETILAHRCLKAKDKQSLIVFAIRHGEPFVGMAYFDEEDLQCCFCNTKPEPILLLALRLQV